MGGLSFGAQGMAIDYSVVATQLLLFNGFDSFL